jgi:aromatic ring-cleaving dioxygenase
MSKKPITHKKNGTGGVFQDVGPEFKPMHAFSFQSPQFGILFIYLLAVRVFEPIGRIH